MDLQDFRIFSRVAAVQNLTSVGHELGLTPGTISKRLQALEDELQVRLFDRTTRSVRITAEGQQFLAHVDRILQDIEKARDSVGSFAARPQGTIRISAPNSLGRHELGPAMAEFMRRYPEIEAMVDLCGRPGSLLDEGFDVAIRIGELSDSTLGAKRVGTIAMLVVAAPRYLAEHGEPIGPADLAEHSCLLNGECTYANWTFLDRRARSHEVASVRVTGRLRSNGIGLLARAAIEGHGIVRCAEEWIQDDLASGRLVPILRDWVVNDDTGVYAVYPSARHLVPRVRVFVDFLSEWFRERKRIAAGSTVAIAAELARRRAPGGHSR